MNFVMIFVRFAAIVVRTELDVTVTKKICDFLQNPTKCDRNRAQKGIQKSSTKHKKSLKSCPICSQGPLRGARNWKYMKILHFAIYKP